MWVSVRVGEGCVCVCSLGEKSHHAILTHWDLGVFTITLLVSIPNFAISNFAPPKYRKIPSLDEIQSNSQRFLTVLCHLFQIFTDVLENLI